MFLCKMVFSGEDIWKGENESKNVVLVWWWCYIYVNMEILCCMVNFCCWSLMSRVYGIYNKLVGDGNNENIW